MFVVILAAMSYINFSQEGLNDHDRLSAGSVVGDKGLMVLLYILDYLVHAGDVLKVTDQVVI